MPSALSKIARTLKRSVTISGRGVHTGQPCRVVIAPTEANLGFYFVRQGVKIPALSKYVTQTQGAMTLARDGVSIQTVEHLLAALVGLGYHSAEIQVSGPELPILDGSSLPWVRLLREAGIRETESPLPVWKLERPFVLRYKNSLARLTPSNQTRISCHIPLGQRTQFAEFVIPHSMRDPWIPAQGRNDSARGIGSFETQIAPARTYVQQKVVQAMVSKGLLKGAELSSGILLDGDKPVNTVFRLPNECARHKILDALGDFALLGAPLLARVELWNNTHEFHKKLIDQLFYPSECPTLSRC